MKFTIDVKPTVAQLAEAFADLSDEVQAQFFIEVAAIAAKWGVPACVQWHMVGRHLRDCACSTYEARAMISDLNDGVSESKDAAE